MKKSIEIKRIGLGYVLAILAFLFVSMWYTVIYIKSPVIQIPLITTAGIAGVVAWFHGYKWQNIIDSVLYGISIAMEGLLILLIIGVLIGTWVYSGTVQTIIVYGLDLLSAQWFLPVTLIISAITAIATGSSWTTGGTIGVALMGIGIGLGVNPALVAGTIISGALFGDKISPISDSTNVVSAASGVNLFDHVRHTVWTAGPGLLICLVIVTIIGLNTSGSAIQGDEIAITIEGLKSNYYIGAVLLLPALFIIIASVMKVPAIPTLLLAAAFGIVLALIFQGGTIPESFDVFYNGVVGDTGIEAVDTILTRGGLTSMYYNTSLALSALSLAGILEKTNMLNTLLDSMGTILKSRFKLVVATMITSWVTIAATASQHMALILPSRMYAKAYKDLNLKLVNMTRTLADSGGLLDPCLPWTLSGVFMSGALGISTLEYAPYVFFAFIVPIIALIYAATGIKFPNEDSIKED